MANVIVSRRCGNKIGVGRKHPWRETQCGYPLKQCWLIEDVTMWQLFCRLVQMTSGTAQIPLQDRKKEYVQAANLFKAGHVLLHPD